jgi:hypothetical protein
LAEELRKHGTKRVDYMTIDTEGSELAIFRTFLGMTLTFGWSRLSSSVHANTRPKQERNRRSCNTCRVLVTNCLSVYAVSTGDTDDLIFTRNIDEVVAMSKHAKDGDWTEGKGR